MNNLQIFSNTEFGSVRTVTIDGEPYFVGKDVAEILGYSDTNKAIAMHVDEEDKLNDKTASSLGQRGGWLINESGLYSLILRSNLPTAKRFKHWVTSEVLPSIRKTGGYRIPKTYKEALKELLIAVEENEKLEAKNIEMQPKADYFDELVDRKLNTSFRNTAKELGIKETIFIQWLINKKFVFRDMGTKQLMPYAQHTESGNGYFTVKEFKSSFNDHAGVQTLVTPKGRETFSLLLRREED